MRRETAKTSQRLIVWILIFSITSLALVSFLPWISTAEENFVEGDLYFNYEMMKTSSNTEIKSLAGDLNFISVLFWVIIILCLISFICLTFHASLKFSHFGQIAMALISISLLVFSVLAVYSEYNFIRTADGLNKITLSNIVFHIKYAYIPLIFTILLLVCSIYYTAVVSVHSIKQYRNLKKGKEVKTIPKEEPPLQKPTPAKPKTEKQRLEMENWLAGQAQVLDKKTENPEQDYPKEEITKDKTFLEEEEEKQTTDLEEKVIQQPFPVEEKKIKPKETEELRPSQSFEKALSYAIEKKIKRPEPLKVEESKPQTTEPEEEAKDLQLEQTANIEEPHIRKIKLRCPQCKNVFLTELEGENTKIKCPTCGKEGVIKQQI